MNIQNFKDHELTVGTYNIWDGRGYKSAATSQFKSGSEWYNRFDDVLENITKCKPQILAIQQITIYRFNNLVRELKKLGYTGVHARHNYVMDDVTTSNANELGVATFYLKKRFVYLAGCESERKQVKFTDLSLDLLDCVTSNVIRVFNCQIFSYRRNRQDLDTGTAQMKQIVEEANAGKFTIENVPLSMTIIASSLAAERIGERFGVAHRNGFLADNINTPSHITRNKRIDWIFVKNLDEDNSSVNLEDCVHNDLPIASDHHLVTTTIKFQRLVRAKQSVPAAQEPARDSIVTPTSKPTKKRKLEEREEEKIQPKKAHRSHSAPSESQVIDSALKPLRADEITISFKKKSHKE